MRLGPIVEGEVQVEQLIPNLDRRARGRKHLIGEHELCIAAREA